MTTEEISINYVPTDSLIPYARNSRTHDDAQVAQIAASIREFGWTNPILIDGDNGVVAGHGRLLAARKLGLAEVPVIELSGLTETQRRAYVIADNKLALNAGWDDELLRVELEDLHDEAFDMALLGFNAEELEKAMGLQSELDGKAPDAGIDYEERFSVLVECANETNQAEIFERLTTMGFTCKVLVN